MSRVFVHRYKWGHSARRKQLRKACKEGKVEKLEQTKDGWLYEVPEGFKLAPIS